LKKIPFFFKPIKNQIPPIPAACKIIPHARNGYFLEWGALMDPSPPKRGWGGYSPSCSSGLGKIVASTSSGG